MAERGKCQECGQRVALTKRGRVKGHGQGFMPRGYAAGMVCPGTGQEPADATR